MKSIKTLLVFCLIQSTFCLVENNEIALLIESDEIIIQSLHHDDKFTDDTHPISSIKVLTPKLMKDLPYQNELNAVARITNLAPALLHTIISTESGHQLNVRSPKGAFGLMQLMPRTALAFKLSTYAPLTNRSLPVPVI